MGSSRRREKDREGAGLWVLAQDDRRLKCMRTWVSSASFSQSLVSSRILEAGSAGSLITIKEEVRNCGVTVL